MFKLYIVRETPKVKIQGYHWRFYLIKIIYKTILIKLRNSTEAKLKLISQVLTRNEYTVRGIVLHTGCYVVNVMCLKSQEVRGE